MAIFSSDGQLLGARLAQDEQWRFQSRSPLSAKYITALLLFEDKNFYHHPGFNPLSMARAVKQNLKAGKIVSGGSTITMQTIRLRRGLNRARTIFNKLFEIYWALALELTLNKNEILIDYSSRASFGSNVIGLEAACWRYFEKPSSQLSWAEAACLAVLPNSPALIHPGKNREILKQKRDHLIHLLYKNQTIDSTTFRLSVLEPLPENPKPIPGIAPHLLDYLTRTIKSPGSITTSIDYALQIQMNNLADMAYVNLSANQIHNLAILISDTRSGNVLAYIGNPSRTTQSLHVDHVQAPRSTGSILKPLLFAGALTHGKLLPKTLLKDIPVLIDGYQPKNFNLNYAGVIPADQALVQSLNIPFVLLLKQYGLEQFHHDLNQLGLSTITKPSSHYGLSLILGGAEATLWDLVGAYATLGRTLIHYQELNNQYSSRDIHPLIVESDKSIKLKGDISNQLSSVRPVLNAASIYNTFEVLKKLQRPDDAGMWQTFNSNQSISWKTGTSFGFRDAWAIGINAKYTIGIWVGNSTGEGRPSLLGAKVAAPILFDVLSRLPGDYTARFDPPLDELVPTVICHVSGMKSSDLCPLKDTMYTSRYLNQTLLCSYHQTIWVHTSNGLRADQQCYPSNQLSQRVIFNLPPLEEYYYAGNHPEYEKMPMLDPMCDQGQSTNPMSMIQPEPNSSIYIPPDQYGKPGKVIFKLAHRRPETLVYWHLDERYIGSTRTFHEIALVADEGAHQLTMIDSLGNELKCAFNILNRK